MKNKRRYHFHAVSSPNKKLAMPEVKYNRIPKVLLRYPVMKLTLLYWVLWMMHFCQLRCRLRALPIVKFCQSTLKCCKYALHQTGTYFKIKDWVWLPPNYFLISSYEVNAKTCWIILKYYKFVLKDISSILNARRNGRLYDFLSLFIFLLLLHPLGLAKYFYTYYT